MKKLFLLVVMSFFIYSASFSADSNPEVNNVFQETIEKDLQKSKDCLEKDTKNSHKFSKKEFRKKRKDLKKEIKRLLKTDDTTMILVGAGLLIFGLLLYLVVTSALWLGIAVMVLGLVLLLYGVLKRFF